jgi:hypothetical protein
VNVLSAAAKSELRGGDLLHVGEAEHVDVRHEQATIRNRAVDLAEYERLVGQVELEEAILTAGEVVRPPDRVEAGCSTS